MYVCMYVCVYIYIYIYTSIHVDLLIYLHSYNVSDARLLRGPGGVRGAGALEELHAVDLLSNNTYYINSSNSYYINSNNSYSINRAAIGFVPIPLLQRALQASYCTHLFHGHVLRTFLGTGMGMNVTAHLQLPVVVPVVDVGPQVVLGQHEVRDVHVDGELPLPLAWRRHPLHDEPALVVREGAIVVGGLSELSFLRDQSEQQWSKQRV